MSDDQKSSKTQIKTASVKPMTALQGYLDDMLSVATSAVAHEEIESKVEEPVVEASLATTIEPVTETSTNAVEPVSVESIPLQQESLVAIDTVEEVEPEVQTEIAVQVEVAEPEPEIDDVQPATEPVVQEVVSTPEVKPVEEIYEEPVQEGLEPEVAEVEVRLEDTLTQRAVSPEGEMLPYPQWAASGFECLLFYVGGLKLAVPLILLGGIHRIDQELTPLFGQPDWFLGLYPRKTMEGQQNIRVVHTSKWVMPEKQTQEVDPLNHYVISLGDSEWGLLSHKLSDSIRLMPDQVKWRSDAGKRPWLAGTVIDHMCAILDVSSMVDLLNTNSKRIN